MRGVRQQLHWHENPQYRFASGPDLPRDPRLVRNVARLAEYDFSFDLQVFAGQMAAARELVAACPGVTFVLQHAGMPEGPSPEGRARWQAGLRALAGCPNLTVKLSGLGTFLRRNDPTHIADIVHRTLELFGPERCLFGSNFPIEKLWTDYRSLLAAFEAATEGLTEAARAEVFRDTAMRIYRLHIPAI